ncbi:hypothetical protein EXIGLDRAFT_707417 [Exidia glandulosa HHB12029]|uniref:Glutathione S-transferase n=1 Tax=Exidia glandulosa HHB12029 TaxID=1314781 RepID=A0A166NJN7_EXIGL|nr:hypothetical protein EXIGLDRAFT_707417 [Exidia glandulosa HHB12029]
MQRAAVTSHECGGASYKNVFIDYADWPTVKDTKSFGKVPNLVIVDESDGSRKELFEVGAIDAYLAETFDLMPGPTPFDRAEALSVLSALYDLQNKIIPAYFFPTLHERKTAHEKHIAETIPTYLKYHERFVRGETYYFGDKMTVADLKLYQMYLWFEDIYLEKNPLRTHAAAFPKLTRIIDSLAKGKAGDYARNRRDFGRYKWSLEEWKWIFH